MSEDASGGAAQIVTNKKRRRVHRALALYYGMGARDPMTVPEVADELGLREQTVREYLNDTPIAAEVQEALDETAARIRKELVIDLYERLQRLRSLEAELVECVEARVTSFTFERVDAELDTIAGPAGDVSPHTIEVEEGQGEIEAIVPVPREVKEVPQFGRLKQVWEEQRATQEQIEDLLGLEAREEVHVETDVTERKVWRGVSAEEASLPDQDVTPLDEEDSV